MQKIYALYNHGRWIAICPACTAIGLIAASIVRPGEFFVCAEEYPDITATMLIPNPNQSGTFIAAPNQVLREQTKQQAIEASNVYEVIFPDQKKEIERVLRYRPVPSRNWEPGTTMDELTAENTAHGVEDA